MTAAALAGSLYWHEQRGYWLDDRGVVWSGWFALSSDGGSVVRRKIRGRNRCHWGRLDSGTFYPDGSAVPGLCRWGYAE